MARNETFKPLYKKLVEKIELDIIRRNLKTGDFFCILKDRGFFLHIERFMRSIQGVHHYRTESGIHP